MKNTVDNYLLANVGNDRKKILLRISNGYRTANLGLQVFTEIHSVDLLVKEKRFLNEEAQYKTLVHKQAGK